MSLSCIEPHRDGSLLRLHIQPRASHPGPAGRHGEDLKLRVAAPPVAGRANREVVRQVAAMLGLPRSRVRLLSGQGGRRKRVLLEGIEPAEAEKRLRPHLPAEEEA